MAKRMDWRKARKIGPTESSLAPGPMPNGDLRMPTPPDELAKKARKEMRKWFWRLSPTERKKLASLPPTTR